MTTTEAHTRGDFQPEDLVEVKIGVDLFQARVRGTTDRYVLIVPLDDETYKYTYCDFKDVLRVISRPADGEAVAWATWRPSSAAAVNRRRLRGRGPA